MKMFRNNSFFGLYKVIQYSSLAWNLWAKTEGDPFQALATCSVSCYHSWKKEKNNWTEIDLKLMRSSTVTDKSFRTLDVVWKHQRASLSHNLMWDCKLSFLRVYNYCYWVEYWLAGTVHHCIMSNIIEQTRQSRRHFAYYDATGSTLGFSLHYLYSYVYSWWDMHGPYTGSWIETRNILFLIWFSLFFLSK